MKDIDFLPAKYRRDQTQRRRQFSIVVAAALCAVVLATLAYFQTRQLHSLERKLADVKLQYDVASKQAVRLVDVHSKLNHEQAAATLYTYLRHPWPLTQILSAVIGPLPPAIQILELRVTHEARPGAAAQRENVSRGKEAAAADTEPSSPFERALETLRAERDGTHTVVFVSGVTHDEAQLHRYLSELDDQAMIVSSRLSSIKRDDHREIERFHFDAQVIIIGGYGMPDGPHPADQTIQTARRERN